MKDVPQTDETPEKEIAQPPEKQLDTYDNLRTDDNSGRTETYDDLRETGDGKQMSTYDDLRAEDEVTEKKDSKSDADSLKINRHEIVEQRRIDQAAEDIKQNEWMNPQKWKTLNVDDQRQALEDCGKSLGKAYDHPEPPIITKDLNNPNLQGTYGDGYSYRPESPYADKNGVTGADYGIEINENSRKDLFGEDPRKAVETYGHEFRHSYQHEQALRYEKGFGVDDPEKAKEWSENFKDNNYKNAPDAELAKSDPEKYYKKYEEYRNQPVESDAREFGRKLSSSVYSDYENIEKEEK